ncbi:MAG: DUF1365 domain-containing protein [Neptuniibacter sp.]
MAELSSCIYEGNVMHHRMQPVQHRFVYRVFSCFIDLDELAALKKLRLFSINRFNLFSFYEKDHGQGEGNLSSQIRSLLNKRGHKAESYKIKLLCYPRILGYTFNPLSVYFCYNSNDELQVILYEVSNTFGSRHTYLFDVEGSPDVIRQGCNKLMYVSPFMPMDTAYGFRIRPPGTQVSVCIRQSTLEDSTNTATPILDATFSGKHRILDDRSLAALFLKYPLMTFKVIGGIHWEAFKLWRKKLKIQPREKNVIHSISWQDKSGAMHYESL